MNPQDKQEPLLSASHVMKLLKIGLEPERKLCPRCEDCDILATASICDGCEEEIAENATPDGRWVNTPHGWIYE